MILFLIRYIYKPALSEDLMNLVSINNKFDLLGGPKTKGGGGGNLIGLGGGGQTQ